MKKTIVFILLALLISAIFATAPEPNTIPGTRSEVTIGAGDQLGRKPVDMYWKNSLFQCLYFQDELNIVSGSITGVKFYNNFVTDLPNKPTKIWLGTTTQTSLATFIPSAQLTQVFDGNVNYPVGQNTISITFTTPFLYSGGTLVMMVNRPMDTQYFSSTDNFYCQTVGTNRALNLQSDSVTYDPANPPTGATVSGQFPKTTFVYSGQAVNNDLACLSVTGNVTPAENNPTNYVVTVKNNGQATQTSYTVKLMRQGGVQIGSVAGTSITSDQTITYTIPWTPTTIGATFLYGEVVLASDQVPANNISPNLPVNVMPAGVVAITVGSGNQTARMPMDMYYMNSLYETIYMSSELNVVGLLTGIQFYNTFTTNLPNMPTKIWIGETTQTDLANDWIPATQLTQVFDGQVTYPNGQNDILITFPVPYMYTGGNLVLMMNRPMDTEYYASTDQFFCQTVGTNRARNMYSDSTSYDPMAPTGGTVTGMFPKTTFMFNPQAMGSLQGMVSSGGSPLVGATVSIGGTMLTTVTGTAGTYLFPYVTSGTHQVTASMYGYTSVTHTVNIVENQATTQNFVLAPMPQVTVTGRIVGSDAPTAGVAGATINLEGMQNYSATSNATGYFTITGVYASNMYAYQIQAPGYQGAVGEVWIGGTNHDMGSITINEIALPPSNVVATQAVGQNYVSITWDDPGTGGGEWIHYDNGINGDSIGTGGVADFDVAIRFPASALVPYAGMSLQAVKVFPADAGSFSIRVWTGGTASAPATMVVDQPFTATIDQWNTVALNTPVLITGTEELWFGYRCNVTTGYPAGCDAGPVVDGFGNMIYYQGAWSTLTSLAPTLTYNWNIQGYAGFSQPARSAGLQPITTEMVRVSEGMLASSGRKSSENIFPREEQTRVRQGYRVWRLLEGQQGNEALWTSLTASPITPALYIDNVWTSLADGTYRWAIRAVYTGGVMSVPAFSNAIVKNSQLGTIAGFVRNQQNQGLMGATVICGNVTATTNASGAYSIQVNAGTHTVAASCDGYDPVTVNGVVVNIGQTTTQNFILPPSSYQLQDGFESYTDFTLTFAPWTCLDVDQSSTYGFAGTTFPNSGTPMAYIVFNPSATTPALTGADPYAGSKYAACFASVNPPNNDWLFSPQLMGGGELSFWARSFVAEYGLERFKVGVSTTGTAPANFTIISGANYIQAPVAWTQYTYSLAAYAGQPIYIGIQCVSNDAFIFMVDNVAVTGGGGPTPTTQSIPMLSGWNLVSLNVSPADHALATLLAPISASVQQVKGTEGVYIPGNPYSSLTSLTDGRAYSIMLSSPVTWNVTGTAIPASTPISLVDGWNLTAYLPQTALSVTAATQSITAWLQQVKGTDGVYIPNNPYSTLTTMYPGKGYWIKLSGAHNLIYPTSRNVAELSEAPMNSKVNQLPSSMVLLARCDNASAGDILIARVNGELRGAETLISPEGFPAALLQIYTDTAGEEISLWLQKPDGSEVELANRFSTEPNSTLGSYPQFISLELRDGSSEVTELPTRLNGCYPNPFNPSTTISFSIAEESAWVKINIYNLKGQKVHQLTNAEYSKGLHSLVWNGTDDKGRALSSGVYMIELNAGSYRKTAKAMLAK